jgi:hypothetical protein
VVATIPSSWHILGTGDFNGDGKSDVLLENTSGQVGIWLMNGTQIATAAIVGSMTSDWHIVGVGDFNGDGKSDVLWQNANGAMQIWDMNGLQVSSQQVVVSSDAVISAGATLELPSAYSGTVSFAATTGTLKIDNSSSFSGKIAGQLAIGDVIDLADITAGANATIGYSGNNSPGTLTVSDGTHTASIALLGNYSLANFTASSDGHGGTSVVDPPPAGGVAPYTAKDPADPQGVLNQQIALMNQSMASFAPADWGESGTPKDALVTYDRGLLSNLAQPSSNQQHA